MTNFLVMTIFNNIDFDLDFFNTNTNTAIIGKTVTILLGGFIYYNFWSKWTTLGNDNDLPSVDSDNTSGPEDIIVQDAISNNSDNSTVKDIVDTQSDTVTQASNSITHGSETDYQSFINTADIGTNVEYLKSTTSEVLVKNQEVFTEYSSFFNCHWFETIFDWMKSDGTPSSINSDELISQQENAHQFMNMENPAKLEQLKKYLENFNPDVTPAINEQTILSPIDIVTTDINQLPNLTTSPVDTIGDYLANVSPDSPISIIAPQPKWDIDLNILNSSNIDVAGSVISFTDRECEWLSSSVDIMLNIVNTTNEVVVVSTMTFI